MEGLDPCFYCGKELVPPSPDHPPNEHCLDHLTPISRGGENEAKNLVSACRVCNTQKGTKTLEEFRAYMALERDPDHELRGRVLRDLLVIGAFGPLTESQRARISEICIEMRDQLKRNGYFAGELRVN